MGVAKGIRFSLEDVYVDYPFEQVMFRWDHTTSKIYRRLYGQAEFPESIPHDNRLFNDTLLFGDEISKEEYLQGKSCG